MLHGGPAAQACVVAPADGPSPRVLVSSSDGSVVLWDLSRGAAAWVKDGGHTETVFDCRFSSTSPNLLATCSFDSTIRVSSVTTW